MRITKNLLSEILNSLNGQTGKKWRFDYNSCYGGYKLVETVNAAGGIRDISPRLTASEMYCYLSGMQSAYDEMSRNIQL